MDTIFADHILKALVCSYVWIANVNQVSLSEFNKFEAAIVQSQFATQFDVLSIRHYFKDMVTLFEQNQRIAVQLTQELLKNFKGKQPYANEIIRLCRVAIVSDGRINDAEEDILREIEDILGVKRDFA